MKKNVDRQKWNYLSEAYKYAVSCSTGLEKSGLYIFLLCIHTTNSGVCYISLGELDSKFLNSFMTSGLRSPHPHPLACGRWYWSLKIVAHAHVLFGEPHFLTDKDSLSWNMWTFYTAQELWSTHVSLWPGRVPSQSLGDPLYKVGKCYVNTANKLDVFCTNMHVD